MKIKNLSISKHFKTNYRDFALYTLEHRGIPNFYDSLTNVQRIILTNTPTTYEKTMSVVGDCIKLGNYHHGDCLDYHTEINTADGTSIKIGEWSEKCPDIEYVVECKDSAGNIQKSIAHSPRVGHETNEYYELELENGEIFKCTEDHLFLVGDKWVKAKDLKETDIITNI